MIKITFVRHGQTDWNLEKKLQGITDIPLNLTGLNEATKLQKNINSSYDLLITSPLKRAYKTAEILNEKLNLPFETNPLLVERDFGELVGKPKSYDNIMVNNSNVKGLEPIESVQQRVKTFLNSIIDRGKGHYLVVAHGGVIVTMLGLISSGEHSWESTPIGNCTLTSISHVNKWELDSLGERM